MTEAAATLGRGPADLLIRELRESDLDEVARMARDFHAFAECDRHGLGFDLGDLWETLAELLEYESGFVAVADLDGRVCGCVAGLLFPWYLRRADVIAQELWFWSDPWARSYGVGRRLLEAFEAWARATGATVVQVATPGPERLERPMGRLFRRWGYKRLETAWARSV